MRFDYLKSILPTLSEMSAQTGYPIIYLAFRFLGCYITHRTHIREFRTLHLYDYTTRKVNQFLLWRRCIKYSDIINADATAEDFEFFHNKYLFNTMFHDFIQRDWLYLPDSSREDIENFLTRNPEFLIKPCTNTQGNGIVKYTAAEVDLDSFLEEYGNQAVLMEAFIQQHPVLAEINSSSVNTVRLIAVKRGQTVRFLGAGLRCGGAGQFVDNFHHGGAAYPIDLDTGIITGPGADLEGNPILRHPTSGRIMPGLQLPHWDILTEKVREAALLSEHVGYVGWDIAITPEGIELIEGNTNYPGCNIIQLDGPGAYQRLMQFMKETR